MNIKQSVLFAVVSLHILFSLSLFSMQELQRDLSGLQRSLSALESQLEALQQPPRLAKTWSINTDKAPEVILQIVKDVEEWDNIDAVRAMSPKLYVTTLSKKINQSIEKQASQLKSLVAPANQKTVNELKGLLKPILEIYFKALKNPSVDFEWCDCIKNGKRIALIIAVLQEIEKKYPDKNKRLVYTSLGAGGLMQDYLILSELLRAGYKNIKANIIDIEYPDDPSVGHEFLYMGSKEHEEFRGFRETNVKRIADLTRLLKKRALELKAKIAITVYNSVAQYLANIKGKPAKRSNVLLMVDPGVSVVDVTYPSEATGVSIGPGFPPSFALFIPKHQRVQLYENIQQVNDREVQALKAKLLDIIAKTPPSGIITKIHKEILEKDETQQMRYWADAHMQFQDLVWNTLAERPVVYTLAQQDSVHFTIEPQPDTSTIRKIDINTYKNEDVITPNYGTYLSNFGIGTAPRRNQYRRVQLQDIFQGN